MEYRKLKIEEINLNLFKGFNRYQKVTRCWRKEAGRWKLKEIAFTEQWEEKDYLILTECLIHTMQTNGAVFGAFEDDLLKGFCSVENKPFGSQHQYLQLSSLHTSFEERGKGIGKSLFHLACEYAKNSGAKKLYISSHSAEESQAFYKAAGCIEAAEYNKELAEAEPCDCQLEYLLQ